MPITFNSQGGFLNGTISSSNGDLFITTSGSAGQISIGNLKLSGAVVEELDNSGVVRVKKTFNDDGSIQIQEFSPSSVLLSTTEKNPNGIETIQSASAIANQIIFDQSTGNAKVILSGSTPLLSLVKSDGATPFGSQIFSKRILMSSASALIVNQGLTDDGKYGFRNANTLGSSTDTDFFLDTDGKVHFNKGIVTTQITSSIITSSIIQTEGSNIFGDTESDTHLFNGNITASGDISSSTTIKALAFTSAEKNVASFADGAKMIYGSTGVPSHFASDITASNNISASGTITTDNLVTKASTNAITTPNITVGSGTDSVRFVGTTRGISGAAASSANNQFFLTSPTSANADDIRLVLGRTTAPTNSDKTLTVEGSISASGNLHLETNLKMDATAGQDIALSDTSEIDFGRFGSATRIFSNTDGDLFIDADNDLELRPDDDLIISVGTTTHTTFFGEGRARINSTSTTAPTSTLEVVGDISASGDLLKTKFLQMTNSSSLIDSFNTGSFRSAKYVLQVTSASNFQVSEMLVLHHNGTASNTEYAQINSGLNLVDFTTGVIGNSIAINASGSFISCSVRLDRTIIPT